MRCAVFALTGIGSIVIKKLQQALKDIDFCLYLPKKINLSDANIVTYTRLSQAVADNFGRYDAFLFIMAAGIVVRLIADSLHDKAHDPAVLVMDEKAHHVISLLSGHIGGANDLAKEVAAVLGSEPVITTATDNSALTAIDLAASRLGLLVFPCKNIKIFNMAILDGKPIQIFLDQDMVDADYLQYMFTLYGFQVDSMLYEKKSVFTVPTVYITDKEMTVPANSLWLRHRHLIAGIGCKKGAAEKDIESALLQACAKAGCCKEDVYCLASTILKSKEKGLLAVAAKWHKNIKFFSHNIMQEHINDYKLKESAFVRKSIGIGNVCEAAAFCCVDFGRICLPKTKFPKVTVALVWEK